MVSHPEPDILECEVKQALGSTAVNKASGCNGIPVELFITLRDDALKVLHSICQQICKATGLEEVNSLIAIPKKGSTKECSNHQTVVFISHADVQAGFRKGRGTRGQCANIHWIIEKAREFQINIYFCFIDNAKAFDCVDHKKLWKILKEMGIPDHTLLASLKTCMQAKKQQLELAMEQHTDSKSGKEYVKVIYCH